MQKKIALDQLRRISKGRASEKPDVSRNDVERRIIPNLPKLEENG